MAHTLPAKQHGLSAETEKKVGTPPQHLTKPCQRGTAASGEGTAPLLPSLVCSSPALHQEGRSLSSFGPTQSSRACSSSLVSNPKVFQTAGFVLRQAADKCGGWQCFGSVLNEALKTSSWGPWGIASPVRHLKHLLAAKPIWRKITIVSSTFECPNPFPLSAFASYLLAFIFSENSCMWVYSHNQFTGRSILSK